MKLFFLIYIVIGGGANENSRRAKKRRTYDKMHNIVSKIFIYLHIYIKN